jgi:hypothetical protein
MLLFSDTNVSKYASRLLTVDVDLAGMSHCGRVPTLAKAQLKSGKQGQNHSSISYFGETI